MGATFLAVGRLVLVLGLVVGVLFALARFTQRFQGGRSRTRAGGRIEVVSRRSLGKNVSLLVVQVARRTFLVGQSAQQMTLLAELEGDEWVVDEASVVGSEQNKPFAPWMVPGATNTSTAWDAFIDHLREMTVRR